MRVLLVQLVFLGGAVAVASQSHTFKRAADSETIQGADTVEELKITSPRLFFSLPSENLFPQQRESKNFRAQRIL